MATEAETDTYLAELIDSFKDPEADTPELEDTGDADPEGTPGGEPETDPEGEVRPEADPAEGEDAKDAEKDPDLDQKVTVKVDGVDVEVSLSEVKAGYQRQADYTRKTQELKAEREAFEANSQEAITALTEVQNLRSGWDENPIDVIAQYVMATGDPANALIAVEQYLAGKPGALPQNFLDFRGIDKATQERLATQVELAALRSQNGRTTAAQQAAEQAARELQANQAEHAQLVQAYETQTLEILAEEGLTFTGEDLTAFKNKLATYAVDNEITNLKAAYKAMSYEDAKAKAAITAKAVATAAARKAAGAVTRTGSPTGGSPTGGKETTDELLLRLLAENTKG